MTIWLITNSKHYYAEPGTSDWQFAGTEDEVRAKWAEFKPSVQSTSYLIRISLNNDWEEVEKK